MPTSRIETFSDGVFAITATLLILNVHADSSHLGHALARAWPSFAAHAVSFVTIGIMWVNHHGSSPRSPTISVVLFAAIAAFYRVESALFGRREPVTST